MIIPHERLAPETLQSLIESYIAREGTDYGESELPMQSKVERLRKQIISAEVVIVFDHQTESINLLPRRDLPVDGDFTV